jgi:hypothetical protein
VAIHQANAQVELASMNFRQALRNFVTALTRRAE